MLIYNHEPFENCAIKIAYYYYHYYYQTKENQNWTKGKINYNIYIVYAVV